MVFRLNDLVDIQFSYYRSRMKRVFNLLNIIVSESSNPENIDYAPYKDAFKMAMRNRLEPEYKLKEDNSFVLIMDKNLEGADAYFGFIKPECV